jgi:hypothetical protein
MALRGSRGRWCSSGARHGGLDCVTLGTGSTGRSRLGRGREQGGAEPESCEGSARATCEEPINACADAQHPAGRTWESFNRGFVYLRVRLVAASCLQTFRLVVVLRTGDRRATARASNTVQYSRQPETTTMSNSSSSSSSISSICGYMPGWLPGATRLGWEPSCHAMIHGSDGASDGASAWEGF